MTGQPQLIVTKHSAERISDRVRDIDHLPSHSDHHGLVRFAHNQEDRYLSVIGKLQGMVSEASVTAPMRASHAMRAREIGRISSLTDRVNYAVMQLRDIVGVNN